LNIVEELEQNLFPSSQRTILFKLLEYVNMNAANSLVLTTHSPYIINYLTLAIKAKEVLGEIQNTTHFLALHDRLKQLVPENAAIANKNVIVYELDELGRIKKLPTHGGLPSDENDLNEALGETNARFSDLLEIELAADNG
jgi:AAA15 family ATPase/GTPase